MSLKIKKSSPLSDQRLARRTDTAEASTRRHLSENYFWQQTQHIFAAAIQKEEYDPDFYIDVALGEAHRQSEEIGRFLAMKDGPRLLLLVGAPGVGKTSLTQHFSKTVVETWPENWTWIYFNGNEHRTRIENDLSMLTQCLSNTCFQYIKSYLSANNLTSDDFLLDIFANDFALSDKAFLYARAEPQRKIDIALSYLESSYNIKISVYLAFLARATPGRVVLVVDNLDPLARRMQAEIVKIVLALSSSFNIRSVVAVRHKTEADLSFNDPGIFSQFVRTPVQSPALSDVIRKRVSLAVKHPDAQNAKIGDGALQFYLRECPDFENILLKGLSAEGVQRVIQGASNESVRQGLRISLSIYASPELDPKKIVAKLSPAGSIVKDLWHEAIPNHIAVRAILLRTGSIYEEDIAWVKNIFGTRVSDNFLGPLLRLLVLRFLRNFVEDDIEESDAKEILSDILKTTDYYLNKELAWLSKHDWIERPSKGSLGLTSLGRFIIDEFVFHRDYLSCIAADVDMYPEFERRLKSTPSQFSDRVENVLVLLEYLALREMEMLQVISQDGLGSYCRLFGHKGFVPEMADKILSNMKQLRPDASIALIVEGFKKLLESREIGRITEMLERFGGRV